MTTQGEHAQPEALRLAEMLEDAPLWESQAPTIAGFRADDDSTLGDAAAELRRLHARIAELEAQLESIGAGGVSGPLMGRASLAASAGSEPVAPAGAAVLCWVNEDELPEGLTQEAYSALFHHSKVDVVRMFPIFGPTTQAAPAGATDAGDTYADYQAWVDLATQASQMGDEPHAELRKSWEPGQRWQQRLPAFTEWFNLSVPPAWFWYAEYRRNPDDVATTAQPAPAAQPVSVAKDRLPNWSVESHLDAINEPVHQPGQEKRVVEARRSAPALHPKTADLVQRFSAALAEKLAAAEKKYGYSDGWASPDWMDECRQHLNAHIAKGDPRDVAAYCAFLWHHGASTAPAAGAVAMAEAWRLSADDCEVQDGGVSADYNKGLAEGMRQCAKDLLAAAPTPPAQAADSVLEDAARWQELRAQHEDDAAERCCVFAPNDMRECLVPVGSLPGELDAFIDAKIAARKQGAKP